MKRSVPSVADPDSDSGVHKVCNVHLPSPTTGPPDPSKELVATHICDPVDEAYLQRAICLPKEGRAELHDRRHPEIYERDGVSNRQSK